MLQAQMSQYILLATRNTRILYSVKKHGITTLQRGGKAFTITYESIWPFCSRLCGSAEYADNRISLFSAQWGKCAVTGEEFSSTHEIHCHHKLPRYLGGDDSYGNLILVKDSVHKLIHAINADTIAKYLELLQLDKSQLKKVNTLRELASLPLI